MYASLRHDYTIKLCQIRETTTMGGMWEQESLHAGPLTLPPLSPSSNLLTQAVAKLQRLQENGRVFVLEVVSSAVM